MPEKIDSLQTHGRKPEIREAEGILGGFCAHLRSSTNGRKAENPKENNPQYKYSTLNLRYTWCLCVMPKPNQLVGLLQAIGCRLRPPFCCVINMSLLQTCMVNVCLQAIIVKSGPV
jgi:hypothetical protein